MSTLGLRLGQRGGEPLTVLCLGAHCDDIEIGCGGTVLRLVEEVERLAVHWVVLASTLERADEAEQSAAAFLGRCGNQDVVVQSFRESYFPWVGAEIKDFFESLAKRVRPDVVLTHTRADRHQDHRIVSDLTWNTFRRQLVLEYEIPKWDGDLATPNVYLPLCETQAERKIELLLERFPSQRTKPWFDADTFRGLMRLRGVECDAPGRFAEAFHARKLVL